MVGDAVLVSPDVLGVGDGVGAGGIETTNSGRYLLKGIAKRPRRKILQGVAGSVDVGRLKVQLDLCADWKGGKDPTRTESLTVVGPSELAAGNVTHVQQHGHGLEGIGDDNAVRLGMKAHLLRNEVALAARDDNVNPQGDFTVVVSILEGANPTTSRQDRSGTPARE